MTFFR